MRMSLSLSLKMEGNSSSRTRRFHPFGQSKKVMDYEEFRDIQYLKTLIILMGEG